jgi:hypothetical protein
MAWALIRAGAFRGRRVIAEDKIGALKIFIIN